jgi:alpha-galactosidase
MSAIAYSAANRIWLLTTPSSAYALRLDEADVPCHLHWGAVLTLDEVEYLAQVSPLEAASSFEGRPLNTEELAIDGGTRYGVPALQVRFADGTRALEWAHAGYEITTDDQGATLTVRMCDRYYPLEVELCYRVFHDSDVIERHARLRHTGAEGVITVLRADSASWNLPHRKDYRVSHVVGRWGAETQLVREQVPIGELAFTSRRGITSHHANPWVMLDAGDAGEEHGEVWSAALAWSGSWRATVQRTPDGTVGLTGGFGHDGISWRLLPGETLQTPVFAGLYADGGFGATSRSWHDHVLHHVLPHAGEERPVLYNSWEATGFDVDEAGQRELAVRAAALGVELFVMDDGWFGGRRHDSAGLGDWQPNPDRFPNGLDPLVKEVHRLGMRFGLWVEPEMVNPDSDLYRQNPDWVMHFPHRDRSLLRNQLVLNFANPRVADWAFQWLDALVAKHGIDFLKWDMNRAFSEVGWPERAADADRTWIDHVRNVYSVIDRLRAAHPGLRIESCSGGGGRVDLGILARTDQVWTSDNTDAQDRLFIQHGFSQLYPTRVMSCWVTDAPNPLTGSRIPLRYRCHVAMSGIMALGGDLTRWSEEEMDEAARAVARYKEIRRTVQHGTLHRLRAPGDDGLTAVQFVSPDQSESVVFGWLRAHRFGMRPGPLRLTGIDPAARYRDRDTGEVHHGAVLRARGLVLNLPPGDYASSIVVLDRVHDA